jgi:hypothetical protein
MFGGGDSSKGQHLAGSTDRQVAALILLMQKGSLRLSASFIEALKRNASFRQGVEHWLNTKVGQQQLAMYQGDKNTAYTMQVGGLPSHDVTATGQTTGSDRRLVGPTQAVECKAVTITINLSAIMNRYELEPTESKRNASVARQVTYTMGHEGFHAHDLGSGLITDPGYWIRKNNLDPGAGQNITDPRDVAWDREINGGGN